MTARFIKPEVVAIALGLLLAVFILAKQRLDAYDISLAAIVALAMVVWIAWHDIRYFTIPDAPLWVIAIVGGGIRLAAAGDGAAAEGVLIAMDAFLCGGALLAIREIYFRLRGVDGLGFGDVKLAVAAGILVGTVGFAWALFLASTAGIAVVLAASFIAPQHMLERLPFGAFLAPVCWGVWIMTQ